VCECVCSTAFEDCFVGNLQFCHRLETNKIRNIAKLFAHLLGTHAISWEVLSAIRITEADTTSATRIFYKCLFQELAENLGLQALVKHMGEPSVSNYLAGVFPRDSMANMRFSINFFTAVGLGGLTTALREDLKKAQAEMKEADVQRQLAALHAGALAVTACCDRCVDMLRLCCCAQTAGCALRLR
jgi:pre-mRNA-splicing factor CWC22